MNTLNKYMWYRYITLLSFYQLWKWIKQNYPSLNLNVRYPIVLEYSDDLLPSVPALMPLSTLKMLVLSVVLSIARKYNLAISTKHRDNNGWSSISIRLDLSNIPQIDQDTINQVSNAWIRLLFTASLKFGDSIVTSEDLLYDMTDIFYGTYLDNYEQLSEWLNGQPTIYASNLFFANITAKYAFTSDGVVPVVSKGYYAHDTNGPHLYKMVPLILEVVKVSGSDIKQYIADIPDNLQPYLYNNHIVSIKKYNNIYPDKYYYTFNDSIIGDSGIYISKYDWVHHTHAIYIALPQIDNDYDTVNWDKPLRIIRHSSLLRFAFRYLANCISTYEPNIKRNFSHIGRVFRCLNVKPSARVANTLNIILTSNFVYNNKFTIDASDILFVYYYLMSLDEVIRTITPFMYVRECDLHHLKLLNKFTDQIFSTRELAINNSDTTTTT